MPSPTVVNLSVHRNTRDQRRAKRQRKNLVNCARSLAREGDIAGWAMVVWNKDWDTRSEWEAAGTMPDNNMSEFVKRSIERRMSKEDAKDG